MPSVIIRFPASIDSEALADSPTSLKRRFFPIQSAASLGLWLLCAWLGSASSALSADEKESPESELPPPLLKETWGVGPWIWGDETQDKQTCRFWRSFEIPSGQKVAHANLRISVDNGYRLMLDGREIGSGSDWRSITEYNLGKLLEPGHHVVAVEGFNDNREAGMQFGMKIELTNGQIIEVFSGTDWRVVPLDAQHWESSLEAPSHWGGAVQVGSLLSTGGGWKKREPTMLMKVTVPPPKKVGFWLSFWFQATLWVVASLAVLLCLRLMTRLAVQSKGQELLHRERARIARDIHDELGARLTELALQGEVIQTELPKGSGVAPKLEALCEKARAVSGAMDEVVWMLNSRRDTLPDFANYACKYAQRFLASSPVRCRLDVDANLPALVFELPIRRNLILAVKEALNNAVKYSEATELFLRIHRQGQNLSVVVEDNGKGFDLDLANPQRNGLHNMEGHMNEVGGKCKITTKADTGCRVEFLVALRGRAQSSSTSQESRPSLLTRIGRLLGEPSNKRNEHHTR